MISLENCLYLIFRYISIDNEVIENLSWSLVEFDVVYYVRLLEYDECKYTHNDHAKEKQLN
jgi:hypothetical protein